MSYVDHVLQPGERVLVRATIHWVAYLPGILALIATVAVFVGSLYSGQGTQVTLEVVAVLLLLLTLWWLLGAWWRRWGTEIAVTDRRVIYKKGVIRRATLEMNLAQIESVEVDQTVSGRILGYGDITLHGSGETQDPIRRIAHPTAVRSAITAR